jgi:hypothetical protein
LGLYTFFVVGQAVVWNIVNVTFVFAGIKASRTLHERLVKAIFGTNLRFYDATPVGRYVIVFSVHAEALE